MQHVVTVERADGYDFETQTNKLIKEGYSVQSSCITRSWVGTEDESSTYKAILMKEE